ncbi:hypothetical protein B0T16DRAFT_459178 [Cercophora newfieldiana]|uniref:Uncharacterized protein n=1 Tax=Cercophora newfieldiana TaxID=92897 RepID=A0AA39XZI3_9PEZI|nr:hypothetical protein B0T16DRAFT_459178 [Cercophora newfieldiana]
MSSVSSIDTTAIDSPENEVTELFRGFYAAPKIKMEPNHLEAWVKIKERLQNTLQNTYRPKPGMDSTMSLEFMMAGQSQESMQPAVILVCCSDAHRKQLKKILRAQTWIAEYGYPCLVVVDPLRAL